MKNIFYIIIIILVVGVWLGVNFAKNQPLFSDPFADREIRERAAQEVEKLGEKAKDAVDSTIDKVRGD
jgi:hypothetical protein